MGSLSQEPPKGPPGGGEIGGGCQGLVPLLGPALGRLDAFDPPCVAVPFVVGFCLALGERGGGANIRRPYCVCTVSLQYCSTPGNR